MASLPFTLSCLDLFWAVVPPMSLHTNADLFRAWQHLLFRECAK